MINEANSDMSHAELVSYLAMYLRSHNNTVWTELPLPTKVRPDIICKTTDGLVEIYECKTRIAQDEIDKTQRKYLPWCHRLYLATDEEVGDAQSRLGKVIALRQGNPAIGLYLVNRRGYSIKTLARTRPMDADKLRQLNDWLLCRPWWNPGFGGALKERT